MTTEKLKTYQINEIFYSLQGEGMRAGTPNVFIRFAGCNLKCDVEAGPLSPGGFACDTEFASGRKLTKEEIAGEAMFCQEEFRHGTKIDNRPAWAILTGGEPGLQLDEELVDYLKEVGFKLAIETNGSVRVGKLGLDWITVSPKVAEHAVQQLTADEVKYVRGYGQGIPKPTCQAVNKLISPAFNGSELDSRTLAWCIKLVKENPDWRLSVQQHKSWRVR